MNRTDSIPKKREGGEYHKIILINKVPTYVVYDKFDHDKCVSCDKNRVLDMSIEGICFMIAVFHTLYQLIHDHKEKKIPILLFADIAIANWLVMTGMKISFSRQSKFYDFEKKTVSPSVHIDLKANI